MKIDDTHGMLVKLNADLESALKAMQEDEAPSGPSPLMLSLFEGDRDTARAVSQLEEALKYLSSDVGRGTGSFYDASGNPEEDYWIAAIWSAASVGGPLAKESVREWSKRCPERYDEHGFEVAWNSYKPTHSNPMGIGSLFKRAKELGWKPTKSEQVFEAQNITRYKLLGSGEIHQLKPIAWCLNNIYPAKGLCSLYGPSGSGKSFIGLDQAAAISEGVKWFGIHTTKTSVIYVALEGEAGYKNRVAAWELENKRPLPANLKMVMQPFKVIDPCDVRDLASVVPTGSVVFIDTLNRTAPTADENSSSDMGEILEGAKSLQTQIDGLVVLIHHTGKDASKGARGHSSFYAALDGAVEVERTATQRSWSIAKAKDGQDGGKVAFELKRHVLGIDGYGEEISSCTVAPVHGNIFAKTQPKGQSQQAALKEIKKHIESLVNPPLGVYGSPANSACLKFEAAVTFLSGTLTTTEKHKRTNEARRLLTALTNNGFLGAGLDAAQDAWCWLV